MFDGIKEQAIQVVSGTESKVGIMKIEPESLDFGKDLDEVSFTISNIGKSELNWNADEIKESCLSVTPMEGKLAVGENQTVKVVLDRSNMKEELNTVLTISDENTQKNISITAQPYTLVVTQGHYKIFCVNGKYGIQV